MPSAVAAARTESAKPWLPRSLRQSGTIVFLPSFLMRSTVARPSTWSVGTNRKMMSLGIPSDDAVLPWDTTRTPRWFAASMIAATSLLDCGPMISFTPTPASLAKPALARSGSCPVSTMSSVTSAFFSWWLRRLTATSSAARLVLPSDDPAPVIDSNAPTRISVLLDCAGADSVPSANTDASATNAPSAKGRRRTRRMRLSTPSRRCGIPWSYALAYNLANFLRTLALPDEIERWSLTTLREKGEGGQDRREGDLARPLPRLPD